MPRPEVPCKWCNTPTHLTGTKECNGCHEIRMRAGYNMDAARRIMRYLEKEHASKCR